LGAVEVEVVVTVIVETKVVLNEYVTLLVSVDVYDSLESVDGKLAVTVVKTVEEAPAVVSVFDSVDKASTELTEAFDTVSDDVMLDDSEVS
jgi:hypothetical protein